MTETSNKEKGDQFREKLRSLCLAASYQPLREVMISGKKADLVFEIHRTPRPAKIAIEAKSYHNNITKSSISEIIGDYGRALRERVVDEVWVIAENDFSSEARSGIEAELGMHALTYGEFLRNLINFSRYLENLLIEMSVNGIEEYYVSQTFTDGTVAADALEAWIKTDQGPIAVLSTYGMGKTSLAKMVALRLARRALKNNLAPVPVLIRLGDLSSQQEMEGLLGAMFTSRVAIEGYSFPLFCALNSLDHLVLILDGLDEMRHAMSWDDFQYNFRQIKKVIDTGSKAIMLGRPNTFKNEKEYKSVIKGIIFIGEESIRPNGSIEFAVRELNYFSKEDVLAFLARYMSWITQKHEVPRSSEEISMRVSEIAKMNLDELLLRPVHAQMIASIATDFDKKLLQLSRYGLYKEFVSATLARDYDRTSGRGFPPSVKRDFLQKLAWWLWSEGGADTFRPSSIKLSWLSVKHDDRDPDATRRELISGALIETKLADHFYFSHRSFYEFIVAEYFLRFGESAPKIVSHKTLADEIVNFIVEADDKEALLNIFRAYANTSSNSLDRGSLPLLERIYSRLKSTDLIQSIDENCALGWYCRANIFSSRPYYSYQPEIVKVWGELNRGNIDPEARLKFICLIIKSWYDTFARSKTSEVRDISFQIVRFLITNLPYEKINTRLKEFKKPAYRVEDVETYFFAQSCTVRKPRPNPGISASDIEIVFDIRKFAVVANAHPLTEHLVLPHTFKNLKSRFLLSDIGKTRPKEATAFTQLFIRLKQRIDFDYI